ncbi:WD40 repeat domain-containing protein [Flagellimonas pacifica]|uniref:Anaphase-promoting complex subunit 4 WD40 domain-containing protein n=1 Tax=Flagellimonas pacifica TaxID=1247520 RepID=A0A285MD63_9FLAO|nr:WD40 repeat domain-containing protein [Allomuricauda parva]SNY95100.1 Anaphase-promoting complex subunit 4 WD40 domain-containing protein [Allomuricauda parva]
MKKHLSFVLISLLILCVSCKSEENKTTLWTLAWSPNGKYLATGGNQDSLKIFDAKSFELIKIFPVEGVQLSRLKWHPFKNKLAIITQGRTFKAKILDVQEETWTELEGLKSSFRALDWNYTGELLAVSELEKAVSVYTVDGIFVNRFMADPKGVAGLDWHPSKNIMVTVGDQIGIYTQHGDTINSFKARTEETLLLCVEWHKSGDFFAVGDYGGLKNKVNDKDKLIQYWNVEGSRLFEAGVAKVEYRNIRWNPNGEKLASASDALRIWSKEGKLIATSKSTSDYLWGVDWSPDGKYIVTSSKNGKIVIWDENLNIVRVLKP